MLKSGRPELDGSQGYCLGATSYKQSGTLVIHSHCTEHRVVVKELIRLLYETGQLPLDFQFTSIQANYKARVLRHTDRNKSMSYTASFGSFSGGLFNCRRRSYRFIRELDPVRRIQSAFRNPHVGHDGLSSCLSIIGKTSSLTNSSRYYGISASAYMHLGSPT